MNHVLALNLHNLNLLGCHSVYTRFFSTSFVTHISHRTLNESVVWSARRLWLKVVMFYITHSITLLEISQLSTKEILRHTKRTTTTRSFQTTFLKSPKHQQPHDPKPQQQLHDPKQEPFCSVRVAFVPSTQSGSAALCLAPWPKMCAKL